MSTPKQHALFAASSSDRWMNCPGSLLRIAKAPEQKSGAAAEEGTIAHELMEMCLLEDRDADFYKFDLDDNFNEKYPEDMREHVQGFVDYVRSQLQPHFELLVEKRINLDSVHMTEAFGTVDVAIIEPFGVLHIIDFKYGQGYVNHKNNSQMIYYALGIAHEHDFDFEEVRTTIYQPRGSSESDPMKIARTDSFSVEKLKAWEKHFQDAVAACESATVDDVNAGSWCKFCPAKINCPAISKTNFELAQLDFSSPVQPSPEFLTSEQLKTILDRSAYLELWISEVKKYAEEKIKSGNKINGWTMKPTRPQRKWVNAEWTEVHFPELVKESIVTPAEAEKILKKEKWDKKKIEQFMNDNVVLVSSGEKLSQTNNDYDGERLDDFSVD
jgi:hypothetical protein